MNLQDRESYLKNYFDQFSSTEEKYEALVDLGKKLSPFDPQKRIKENLVEGCQSLTYIFVYIKDNIVFIEADSDALISKGLAALFVHLYNGLPRSEIIEHPIDFATTLGLHDLLSLSRSQGFLSMYKKIKNCL